jgi:hypothetical protein
LQDCNYNGPISLSTSGEIEILVDGMLGGSQGTANSDWFFELNSFMYALGILFLAILLMLI